MSSLSAPTGSPPSSIEAKFIKWLGRCTCRHLKARFSMEGRSGAYLMIELLGVTQSQLVSHVRVVAHSHEVVVPRALEFTKWWEWLHYLHYKELVINWSTLNLPEWEPWRSQGTDPTGASGLSHSGREGNPWGCCSCPCWFDPTQNQMGSACMLSMSRSQGWNWNFYVGLFLLQFKNWVFSPAGDDNSLLSIPSTVLSHDMGVRADVLRKERFLVFDKGWNFDYYMGSNFKLFHLPKILFLANFSHFDMDGTLTTCKVWYFKILIRLPGARAEAAR